ncbi:MAG: hypothetical protein NC828_01000 [Candidatus Omnitrophica bacterium]|nr:hypothetical protein [Candidatus Omnitrophota bacterium]
MDFKKALFISFLSHCFILTPIGNLGFFQPEKKITKDIQITYYQIKPPKIEPLREQATISKKENIQPDKSGMVEIKRPSRKMRPSLNKQSKITKIANSPEMKPVKNVLLSKENAIPDSIPGTTLPNTPECMHYYNYIREEIRCSLEKKYKPHYEEGEVGISFVLNHEGELVSIKILEGKSSDDPFLHQLSCEAIKAASPFKSFPEGLKLKQISFNLAILFKRR